MTGFGRKKGEVWTKGENKILREGAPAEEDKNIARRGGRPFVSLDKTRKGGKKTWGLRIRREDKAAKNRGELARTRNRKGEKGKNT